MVSGSMVLKMVEASTLTTAQELFTADSGSKARKMVEDILNYLTRNITMEHFQRA